MHVLFGESSRCEALKRVRQTLKHYGSVRRASFLDDRWRGFRFSVTSPFTAKMARLRSPRQAYPRRVSTVALPPFRHRIGVFARSIGFDCEELEAKLGIVKARDSTLESQIARLHPARSERRRNGLASGCYPS